MLGRVNLRISRRVEQKGAAARPQDGSAPQRAEQLNIEAKRSKLYGIRRHMGGDHLACSQEFARRRGPRGQSQPVAAKTIAWVISLRRTDGSEPEGSGGSALQFLLGLLNPNARLEPPLFCRERAHALGTRHQAMMRSRRDAPRGEHVDAVEKLGATNHTMRPLRVPAASWERRRSLLSYFSTT